MDFTLLKENRSFDFEQYFQPIIDQFSVVGRNVEIKKKGKRNFGKVESAFLKDNTDVYDTLCCASRFVCRKNARPRIPGMEVTRKRA